MEMTSGQVETLAHLTATFGQYGGPDVTQCYDAPNGDKWLRVHLIPHYFLVDEAGVVRHVSERNAAAPLR